LVSSDIQFFVFFLSFLLPFFVGDKFVKNGSLNSVVGVVGVCKTIIPLSSIFFLVLFIKSYISFNIHSFPLPLLLLFAFSFFFFLFLVIYIYIYSFSGGKSTSLVCSLDFLRGLVRSGLFLNLYTICGISFIFKVSLCLLLLLFLN
jgi:hypothetical protein